MHLFLRSRSKVRLAIKHAAAAVLLAQLTSVHKSAHAQISFALDNLSPTFMAPATGMATYYIDGHYSGTVEGTGYSLSLLAYNATGDWIRTSADSDWQAWFSNTRGNGNYMGHLISVTVSANQTPGIYDHFDIQNDSAYMSVYYADSGIEHVVQDNYQVNITPYSSPASSTPEPGPIGLLAGVSLTGCFWLKMRRSRNK